MNKGRIWLVGSLYINSVAISIVVGWFLTSPQVETLPDDYAASEALDAEQILSVKELVDSGDKAVIRGNWAKAHVSFQSASRINRHDPWLNYRLAVVNEVTANLSKATSRFLKLSNTQDSFLVDASQVGLARISMANGNWRDAETNLWRLFLEDSIERSPNQRAEIFHSIARASGEELIAKGQKPKVDQTTPLYLTMPIDAPRLFRDLLAYTNNREATNDQVDDLSKQKAEASDDKKESAPFTMSQGNAPGSLRQRVSVGASNIGILELLETFASQYGFQLAYSHEAEQIVKRHSLRLNAVDLPVQTFLYAVMSQYDLCWFQKDAQLEIFSRVELNDDVRKSYHFQRSAYLLRSAVFDFPDHALVDQSKILLALVEFQRQRWSSSESMLQEVIRSKTLNRTLRNMALFNLGKVLYNLGRNIEATRVMYLVGDDLYGGNIAATAIMIAANEEVNQGNFVKAVRNNSQAISLANTKEIRAQAALAMMVAYLLDGKSFMANQTVVDQRKQITSPTDIDFATFLSALARFQVRQKQGSASTGELLRATLAFEKRINALSPQRRMQAAILVAQAKSILGFDDEAIEELFRVVETSAHSPLRLKVAQMIGTMVSGLENNSRMAAFYERMMKAKLFQSADAVKELRQATIQFEAKNYTACIKTCDRMINQMQVDDPVMLNRILELQGLANQRMGNYYAAALCFAGVTKKQSSKTKGEEEKNSEDSTTGAGNQ